jgi:DNA-binding response OmpR family regulator
MTSEQTSTVTQQAASPVWADGGSRPMLLLIDDDERSVKTVRRYISKLPISVVDCATLEDAISQCTKMDLILCEVRLGERTGIEIVVALRQHGYRGKIMMVSGDCSRSTVLEYIELGVHDYVVKPFARELLCEKICRHLAMELPAE